MFEKKYVATDMRKGLKTLGGTWNKVKIGDEYMIRFFLFYVAISLCFFSCTHRREVIRVSLSEAEQGLAADAARILGLKRPGKKVSQISVIAIDSLAVRIVKEAEKAVTPADGNSKNTSVRKYMDGLFLDTALLAAYNRFACDFLGMALRRSKYPNLAVCPLSLEMLLSLVANGVDRSGYEEILRYLNMPSIDKLNEMNRWWFQLFRDYRKPAELSLSNSIWSRDEIEIKEAYKEAIEKTYDVTFFPLSADVAQSQREINIWASEKTHGMIPTFLQEPLKPTIMLALYNACYFKNEWKIPFRKEATKSSKFKTPWRVVEVPTMHGDPFGTLYRAEKYEAVDIDYKGREICMRVVLPRNGFIMEDVIKELTKKPTGASRPPIRLSMPKFKIRDRMDNMENMLMEAGIKSIFSNPDCFMPMTDYPDVFKEVVLCQETVMDCDEEGTSATAVTGLSWATSTGEALEYVHFNVDRPFIFLILERKSGAILFAGVVRDPTK